MLRDDERKMLLQIAREAITAKVKQQPLSCLENANTGLTRLIEPGGAFVTLKKRGRLRGCIGLLESDLPLQETVQHMAVAAATEDSRFPVVQSDELRDLHIEISALSVLQQVEDVWQLRMGIDGVLVRQGQRSGVFLPQVAIETGWTLERFLNELCENKAGLAPDAWKDSETELYRFTVEMIEESP